jgi:hypothetical protein
MQMMCQRAPVAVFLLFPEGQFFYAAVFRSGSDVETRRTCKCYSFINT